MKYYFTKKDNSETFVEAVTHYKLFGFYGYLILTADLEVVFIYLDDYVSQQMNVTFLFNIYENT